MKTENEKKLDTMTPKEIVEELNKHIVGQDKAKKAVAIALRNRIRRLKLPPEIAEEIAPKNIIMIGPTGVGKTEIARRLAKLANSPFLKVEATKFTEVGYVGKDAQSMIRDLVQISISMVKKEMVKLVEDKARKNAIEKILDVLLPPLEKPDPTDFFNEEKDPDYLKEKKAYESHLKVREKMKKMLINGELDDKEVEIEVDNRKLSTFEVFSQGDMEEIGVNVKDLMDSIFPSQKKKKVKVKEAIEIYKKIEEQELLDIDKVIEEAIKRTEHSGIIFIDEMDKVAGRESGSYGPDVSREGVQRDILPIVEGTTVNTKYGPVKTDHILFIASGAFHVSSPSDLIPELQGRFPIRVELNPLHKEDLMKILVQPESALTKQYKALLSTEGIEIIFTEESIEKIAEYAEKINSTLENIGARRLHTIMEKVLEDIMFEAPDVKEKRIVITPEYVEEKLKDFVKDQDLSKYIL